MGKKLAVDLIVKPIVSEKSVNAMALGKYCFEVNKNTNKIQVRKAVEEQFKVKVDSVNCISVTGKQRVFKGLKGKTRNWKKMIVTLKPGQKIDVFEGA